MDRKKQARQETQNISEKGDRQKKGEGQHQGRRMKEGKKRIQKRHVLLETLSQETIQTSFSQSFQMMQCIDAT